jgi:hypothetical protein
MMEPSDVYWVLEIPYFNMNISINIIKSSVGRLL